MVKYLVLFALSVACASAGDLLTGIGDELTKDIITIKEPIEETIVALTFLQCQTIKKLIGVDYNQLNGTSHEPDLNQLTMICVTADGNVSMPINSVPQLLPKMPSFYLEKLLIYIHGFLGDPSKGSVAAICSAYIKRGYHKVLALDASGLLTWPYLRATTYARFVGEKLGSILAVLVKDGLLPALIHVIGHSLGAQVAGFVGKIFTKLTGKKLGRITALDAAGPCFELGPEFRISATDADYVDGIHTNAGVLGTTEPVGLSNFWLNGGHQQPECNGFDICSHHASLLRFIESIGNECGFAAARCDSWAAFKKGQCDNTISCMGEASKPGTTGNYYLQTAPKPPYALGMKGATYNNNAGIVENIEG